MHCNSRGDICPGVNAPNRAHQDTVNQKVSVANFLRVLSERPTVINSTSKGLFKAEGSGAMSAGVALTRH